MGVQCRSSSAYSSSSPIEAAREMEAPISAVSDCRSDSSRTIGVPGSDRWSDQIGPEIGLPKREDSWGKLRSRGLAGSTPEGRRRIGQTVAVGGKCLSSGRTTYHGIPAEVLAPQVRRPTCPYCGSPPLVGVLRPEGEGAKRSLICSFCRTEWDYLRIACPACGERREEKLSVYTTPKFEAVRVEACDTCKAYIKTVDLARNGLAVPEVDELAAVPLTLWADENGYRKATSNVLFP